MAQSVATRLWRPTTPEAIESELAALWREAGRESPIARAVMSNLVVYCEGAGPGDAIGGDLETLAEDVRVDDVVARHPSRVILISHDRRPKAACAPLAAGVGVATFGPEQARFGVEIIAVRSACAEQSLASIVRRLLRGDVPTSVWWTADVSQAPPLDAIVAAGRQFVYDSRGWHDVRRGVLAVAALTRGGRRLDLADVNWRRLAPLRHAIADAVGVAGSEELRRAQVHVAHRPGDAALAWLALGWLRARLRWPPAATPRLEELRNGDEILSVSVDGTPADLSATLDDHRVLVTPRAGAAPFTVSVPREDVADIVAAELRNLSHDVGLHDALSALVGVFEASI